MSRILPFSCVLRPPRVSSGILGIAGLVAVCLLCLMAMPALAQNVSDFGRSYIDPFPAGDRYRVVVLGDSLGDGLWSGLYRTFEEDRNLDIIKRSKVSTGFVRPDYYDWNAALEDILKDRYQIAVVMVGAKDMQPIRANKQVLKFGDDEWREVYGKRVEDFMKKLKAKNVAVYWVGLPIMRSPDQNRNIETLNEVFREKAFINGVKFIDTWSGFADQFGRYSAYGPDMSGQVRRLRADDGMHFTMRGYLKLAHFVEKEVRRDLNLARLERNIPLLGDENEQARAVGRDPSAVRSADRAADANRPEAGAAEGPQGAVKTGSVVAGVELVRPAISETALQAAQNLGTQTASLMEGETVANDIGGGLTALASISPANELSGSAKPNLPLTERPYYRVLIKGEQLEPKGGRADDYRWTGN
jgi:uncharacterized protein